jgi:hypothetical protein
MSDVCSAKGCKTGVPAELAADHLCVLHFTLFVEQECTEMRRAAAFSEPRDQRQAEFFEKIAGRGERLIHVATSGFPMTDEIKARILSTLLTLMNCRENIDRTAKRHTADRRFVG